MPRYAELIYNGFWFSPERDMLQALIDKSQEHVEGEVRLTLYKGNVIVAGRESAKSLYSSTLVTFEDDKGAYDQKDAEGFIRFNALRLRTLGIKGQAEEVGSRRSPLPRARCQYCGLSRKGRGPRNCRSDARRDGRYAQPSNPTSTRRLRWRPSGSSLPSAVVFGDTGIDLP